MFKIGDYVKRYCPNIVGHNSIGQITTIYNVSYGIAIIEGKNGMKGWDVDVWSKSWCRPYNKEPDWEV